MWTWCTHKEWHDKNFDWYWCECERCFHSEEEARRDAEMYANDKYYVIKLEV